MSQTLASPLPAKAPGAGLEGVVAAKSGICFIDGNAGRLVYRGYEIGDLVENASFEEVAYLLWHGKLPNRSQLDGLRQQLGREAALAPEAMKLLRDLPRQTLPIDALRTMVSALGALDPDLSSNEPDADLRKSIRLSAQLPTIVTAFHRLRNDAEPVNPDPRLSVAAN